MSAELAHIIAGVLLGHRYRKYILGYTLLRHQDAEFIVDNHYCDGKEVLFC